MEMVWNRKKIGCQPQTHSGYLRVVLAIKTISGVAGACTRLFYRSHHAVMRVYDDAPIHPMNGRGFDFAICSEGWKVS